MLALKRALSLAFIFAAVAFPAAAGPAPDYLVGGLGVYDFDKHDHTRRSIDYRVGYEWGVSLLPLVTPGFKSIDAFVQMHPLIGFEGNGNGAMYPHAGIDTDILLGQHGVFSWGEAVGFFGRGSDPRTLGSIVEFRSELELGWEFEKSMRVSATISHISNAHIVTVNPGAESIGVNVRIPMSVLIKP